MNPSPSLLSSCSLIAKDWTKPDVWPGGKSFPQNFASLARVCFVPMGLQTDCFMFLLGPNSGDMDHFQFLLFSSPTSLCSNCFASISHYDYAFACWAFLRQPESFLFTPKCYAKVPSQCQLGSQSLNLGREWFLP